MGGEEVKIIAVEAENGGTCIQVDFEVGGKKDRMFINTKDILVALNNCLYNMEDNRLMRLGFTKVDDTIDNPNLI